MSLITDLIERVRSLVFRHREERELDDELRFHVEMEAEHLRERGVGAAEARRRSRLALGGVEQVKEEVRDARGTRLFEDSMGDVRYALRTLARSPGFALVVILTLALGIGGTTAVFSAVDAVLLQPLPYREPGQLARLYQTTVENPAGRGVVTPVHYVAYRNELTSAEAVAAIYNYDEVGADIGSGESARRIRVLPTSANYFDVVGVQPAIGGAYRVEDEYGSGVEDNIEAAPVAVISRQVWQDYFQGDPAAIGRTLVMNGKAYQVDGVMPEGFEDPIAGAVDAWVPLDLRQGTDVTQVQNHYLSVIARLRPGVTIERAQAELDGLSLRLAEQYPQAKEQRARLDPLKEDIVGSSSRALEIMLGAVALVLVLVCVNIANLMLVRGSERGREFAVRSALGAGRTRLLRQLLIESLTLALTGAIAGLLVARLAMSAIVVLGSGTIPRLAGLALDPRLLAFSLALAVGSAVLFGLTPAVHAARTEPGEALGEQSRGSTSGGRSVRTREWLVVSQVAMALVLLVGAGLLLASFHALGQVRLGVRSADVLTFELHLPQARYDSVARGEFYEDFATRVMSLPGVRAAGGTSKLPATGPYHQWGTMALSGPFAGDETKRFIGAQNRVVSGDYFEAVGVPVLDGRTFDARDRPGTPDRVVVNEYLADRLFPGVSAVGQTLRSGGRNNEVIGVVGNVAVTNEGGDDAFVYHAHAQFAGDRPWALTQVVSFTGSARPLEQAIRRTLAEADPMLVMYHPMLLDDAIGRGASQRRFTLRILITFAAVALALSALGLFGLLSYGVKLRSREFGIRMALGAERRTIGTMVLRRGLAITGIGVGIGLVGALALSRVMSAVLFRVSPVDPVVLAGSIAFMGVVGGIAAWLPARRATGVKAKGVLG